MSHLPQVYHTHLTTLKNLFTIPKQELVTVLANEPEYQVKTDCVTKFGADKPCVKIKVRGYNPSQGRLEFSYLSTDPSVTKRLQHRGMELVHTDDGDAYLYSVPVPLELRKVCRGSARREFEQLAQSLLEGALI